MKQDRRSPRRSPLNLSLSARTARESVPFAFALVWTAIWVPSAIVVLILTLSRRVPLAMARRIWAAGILRVAGARVEVHGLENVDFTKPHVFVANHESALDIPVIFAALPVNLHFILKKELAWAPFVGLYAWAMGMIFVDRGNKSQAVSSLRRVGKIIRSGRSVIAYPEGTRSLSGTMLPFKKGAFVAAIEAGVPVVPVAISGAAVLMSARSVRVKAGLVRVTVGRPIPTAELTHANRDQLCDEAFRAVARLRGQS